MIAWTNPAGHFASAYVGDCRVASVRTEPDQAVVVFYLGEFGSARWNTATEARAHVERYVAAWLKAAGLAPIEQRAAA